MDKSLFATQSAIEKDSTADFLEISFTHICTHIYIYRYWNISTSTPTDRYVCLHVVCTHVWHTYIHANLQYMHTGWQDGLDQHLILTRKHTYTHTCIQVDDTVRIKVLERSVKQVVAGMCSRLQHPRCNTLQHTATYCNMVQHTAPQCNTLQHTATHCKVVASMCKTLQHTAAPTLQHTATHCDTLQHGATHCSTLQHTATHVARYLEVCETCRGW